MALNVDLWLKLNRFKMKTRLNKMPISRDEPDTEKETVCWTETVVENRAFKKKEQNVEFAENCRWSCNTYTLYIRMIYLSNGIWATVTVSVCSVGCTSRRDPSFSKHPASLSVPCAASSCSFISSYRSPLETSARRKWTAKFIIIFTFVWATACCTASRSRMWTRCKRSRI